MVQWLNLFNGSRVQVSIVQLLSAAMVGSFQCLLQGFCCPMVGCLLLIGMGQFRAPDVPERRAGLHDNLGKVVSQRGELRGRRVQHPPAVRQDRVESLQGQVSDLNQTQVAVLTTSSLFESLQRRGIFEGK